MIEGVIRKSDGRPVIPLTVGWHLGVQDIVALVDTGFGGELKIPPEMVSELGLSVTHTKTVLLANETGVNMPAALAFVSMEGTMNEVDVLICEGTAVVGVKLLKRFGYSLTVDFKNSSVSLEKK